MNTHDESTPKTSAPTTADAASRSSGWRGGCRVVLLSAIGAFTFLTGRSAHAQDRGATAAQPAESVTEPAVATTPPPVPAKKPFAYSIPWQLRPVAVPNVIRSDTAFAFYERPADGEKGTTIASILLGSYRISPSFGVLVRAGAVKSSPPGGPKSPGDGTAIVNPALGGTYLLALEDLRIAFFLGLALPLGQGGGKDPDRAAAGAAASGVLARSALDNAMFALNYFTVFPGVGVAWVKHGLTLQAEATVFQLTKTRGPDLDEKARTNFTSGFHAGYFFVPQLSVGAELRYQRWLENEGVKAGKAARDNVTMAVGPRVHIELGGAWLRPGVAYARGLDKPMTDMKYNIVQLDVILML
jgi:hypothetical protein